MSSLSLSLASSRSITDISTSKHEEGKFLQAIYETSTTIITSGQSRQFITGSSHLFLQRSVFHLVYRVLVF